MLTYIPTHLLSSYTKYRHIINVTLYEDTAHHTAGKIIQALVYSGSITNPNFHYLPTESEKENKLKISNKYANNNDNNKNDISADTDTNMKFENNESNKNNQSNNDNNKINENSVKYNDYISSYQRYC